jgi:hypothetical protein
MTSMSLASTAQTVICPVQVSLLSSGNEWTPSALEVHSPTVNNANMYILQSAAIKENLYYLTLCSRKRLSITGKMRDALQVRHI